MNPILDELKVFTGNGHPELAKSVCEYLDIPLGQAEVFKFANDNTFVRIHENIRQRDVFIIQPTCYPVNDNLMELLIMIDACKRASAGRITAVVPYYGYGRTDKKDQPRVPITARLVADLLTAAGADRLLTVDLHAGQIQGFFDIPVDHLFAAPVFIEFMKEALKGKKPVDGRAHYNRRGIVHGGAIHHHGAPHPVAAVVDPGEQLLRPAHQVGGRGIDEM